uniref:ATP synthase complex subunit 8 n=1 Tax=Hydrothassa glabra TaxID=1425572 RepID=A0A1P8NMA9_9CUCU|nr:ATP synthase F0 subunit 8 [Hydrothassa glabra]
MPQMMPLNWLILMFYFISIFLMFNIQNYFLFLYSKQIKKTSHKNISFTWKW